jgi:hypothetical protein
MSMFVHITPFFHVKSLCNTVLPKPSCWTRDCCRRAIMHVVQYNKCGWHFVLVQGNVVLLLQGSSSASCPGAHDDNLFEVP